MDVEVLAEKTIESLAVAQGQVICIWASTHSLDLIEALAFRIRSRGAYWTVRLIIEPLLQRIGRDVPREYLALVPEHELRWLKDIDIIIEVHDHGGHIPGVEISSRRAMAAEWIALINEADRLGCRRFTVTNPTQALADAYGLPLEEMQRRYWSAINIDQAVLDDAQQQVADLLAGVEQVRITTPAGTDLSLRLGSRPIHQDDEGLPRGEVYVAPMEDTVNGTAVIERAFIRGRWVEQLRLTFNQGKLVQIEAAQPETVTLLQELLAASSGDKDVFAELGIGLNPGVTELSGDIRLDEKMHDSIHIAIGMNDRFGGRNKSNLHLDLVMQHPQIYLDGRLVSLPGLTAGHPCLTTLGQKLCSEYNEMTDDTIHAGWKKL